ncbi:MAG: ATP-binding protein [Bacteroidota bacterium]|nr:ATP-binding protein [Bacteroidota bacterium]
MITGKESGAYFVFYTVLIFPFILIDMKRKIDGYLGLFITIGFLIFYQLEHSGLLFVKKLYDSYHFIIFSYHLFSSAVLIAISLYYVSKRNLKKQNTNAKLLADQKEEMITTLGKLNEAQYRLESSENRFHDIADNFPGIIYQWFKKYTGEEGFNYITDYKQDFLPINKEELFENINNFYSIIEPEDVSFFKKSFKYSIITRSEFNIEFRLRLKTKSAYPRWIQLISRPVETKNGLLFNGIVLDITEKKYAETNMMKYYKEIENLKLALDESAIVSTTDSDGNIIYVNDAFCKTSMFSKEELIGQNHRIIKSGYHKPDFFAEMWKIISSGKIWHGEILNKNKDGSLYWVQSTIVPLLDEQNKPVQYTAIRVNITAQKEIEEKLRKREKELLIANEAAEMAVKAKSDFLATMSHEIRTPMNGVIGMTSLLLNTKLNDEQKDYIDTIRVSGENLLTILNDILDFSKIEAHSMNLEIQPFNITTCIEEAIELFTAEAIIKNIELIYYIDRNIPDIVEGDNTRIRQIIVNLLSNAIKFTERGEIVIYAKEINKNENFSEIQFSVKDSGIGIQEEKIPNLFKAFSQGDTTTTRKHGGTGLGLAICQRLVSLMNGNIWVETIENKGSTFHFTINLRINKLEPQNTMKGLNLLEGKKALVYFENDVLGSIIGNKLRKYNINPYIPSNINEFHEKIISKEIFDFALIDLKKNIDCLALAKKIKENIKIPVIIAINAGKQSEFTPYKFIDDIVTKPIRNNQLLTSIINLFNPNTDVIHKHHEIFKEVQPEDKLSNIIPLNILVAEDNLINQKLILKVLSKLGYKADVAGNGLEAVEAVERQKYDLLFMDVQMPDMDGYEATEIIIDKFEKSQRPVIIAMTANAMQGDKEICLKAGMDDYMSKPIKLEEVKDKIMNYTNYKSNI